MAHATPGSDGGLRVTGFDRILIPLDGSERAEAVLGWVQVLRMRRLRLLQVCPPDDDKSPAAARDYLEAAAARSWPPGAEVDVRVVTGDPAERIVEEAAEADLIAMTT